MSEPVPVIAAEINRKLAELGRKEFEAELTGSFAPGKSKGWEKRYAAKNADGTFAPGKYPDGRRLPTPAGAAWRRAPLRTARARWQLTDDLGYLWATVWKEPLVATTNEFLFHWNCYDEHGKLAEGCCTHAWRAIHTITSAMAEDPPWLKCVEIHDPRTGVVHEQIPVAAFRDDCQESPPCGGCFKCQCAQAAFAGFETRAARMLLPLTSPSVG